MYVPYDEIDHERLLTTNQEELNKNEAIETDLTNKISKSVKLRKWLFFRFIFCKK